MELLVLFLALFMTAFVYLFIPILLVIINKKFKLSTLKIISVINCIVIYVLVSILDFIMDPNITPNFGAAFMWSVVGYWLLKNRCLIDDSNFSPSTPDTTDTESVPTVISKFKLPSKRSILLIVYNAVLLFSVLYLLYSNFELRDTVIYQRNALSSLQSDFDDLHISYIQTRINKIEGLIDTDFQEMQKDLDELINFTGIHQKNAFGQTYLEYRISRLEKAFGF